MGCTTGTKNKKIVKGSDVPITVYLTKSSGGAFPLTGVTEIKARFLKADDTILEVTMTGLAITVLSAAGGSIKIALAEADTILLKAGDDMSFEVEVVIGGTDTTIIQFDEVLDVKDKLFT
jgi:hypothetical protein